MKALLVDDHALFREGFSMLMAQRFPTVDLIAAADIGEARLALASHPDIELILLDLGLPDSQGLSSLQRLLVQAGEVPLVVMSADERPETILAAIDQGAAGFVPKSARLSEIEGALRIVLDGGTYLPPGIYRDLAPAQGAGLDAQQLREARLEALALSPRQIDVLRLLVLGRSTKLISRELELAESTVKTHLLALFRKLDVSSRTQAIVAAARMGITFDER
ncbi:LuxR C-terminal-related transcriptional regulator [Sphaerotilus mobilis]|uniref:LuxR family two component transcriptional regulator n=1 Tax=Sphaerotilus mobilis TaxID=47994 RepID=A0A4Q7LWH9_9BURK|nr:response regulator transcription factor [Sphaerotilus mobilis]RZS58438.1 LuxR family two component transcriptional regulator [Sphaerotilus mobilis]